MPGVAGETHADPPNIRDRAFDFACRIVKLHGYLQKKGSAAHSIAGQLLRSGTSIGANLEEADAGQSKPDFISKCAIALKEARETQYWLRLLTAGGLVPVRRLGSMTTEANELIAILTVIVRKASATPARKGRS